MVRIYRTVTPDLRCTVSDVRMYRHIQDHPGMSGIREDANKLFYGYLWNTSYYISYIHQDLFIHSGLLYSVRTIHCKMNIQI